MLHEEIGRLPETYRAAVVLCDLEGLTQEQAAQRLGWPSGTVRSRLARGRGRLQARLTRRGLAPSVGAVAALLTAEAATAAVPAALVEATVRAATLAAAGQTVAGAVSAAALSEGVLRAMFMTRLKLISAVPGDRCRRGRDRRARPPAGRWAAGPGNGRPRARRIPGLAEGSAEAEQAARERRLKTRPKGSRGPDRLAEAELKRAEDRIAWADRMYEKGYVSSPELSSTRMLLKQAQARPGAARAKLKEQKTPPRIRRPRSGNTRRSPPSGATVRSESAPGRILFDNRPSSPGLPLTAGRRSSTGNEPMRWP